ncbi:MAG: OmpH family outer membrane protein [Mariprofundaceae bacterium]|nr:OmpH family outer membrane protein [Mariprofundaceae bacterium]
MIFRILGAGALAFGLLVSSTVYAGELKVAFVDINSAVQNTVQYRNIIKHLEGIKNTKQKELKSLGDKISQLDKDLLNQSMAMSPSKLAAKQQTINNMKKDYQRKLQDAQEAMTMERNRLMQGIYTKFGKKVRELGKQKGYDYILTKPSVLYVKEMYNITAEVTKLLDAGK